MRLHLTPVIAGATAYAVVNALLSMASTNPRSILYFLCPVVSAIVADIWHAKRARVLSSLHLMVVLLPTVIMYAVQLGFALTVSTPMGGPGYYALALLTYCVASLIGFAMSATVRTLVFDYGYDTDQAEFEY